MELEENNKIDLKKILIGISFLIVILVVIYLQIKGYIDVDSFSKYINSYGSLGWLIFVIIYVLGIVVVFPASILTLIAGFVFNSLVGFILVIIGASIGALLSFFISRYLFYDYFQNKFANTRFLKWTKTENQKNLTRTIFFMRLLPIFSFNAINYGSGITKITAKRYFLATLLGIMPGTFVYVYLGSNFKNVLSLNFLGAVVLFIVFSYIINKIINRIKFKKSGAIDMKSP